MEGLGGTAGTYRPIDADADTPADEDKSDRPSNRFSKSRRLFRSRKKKKYELPQMIPMWRPKQEQTEQTPVYHDDYHLHDERYKKLEQDHFKFLQSMGFTVDEKLGAGGYGNVYRVRQSVGEGVDREMACKVVSLGMFWHLSYSDAVKAMKNEDKFFRQLSHSHIVKRLEVLPFYDHKTRFPEVIHLLHFMEVMESDLWNEIYDPNTKRLNEKKTRYWLTQIISGVSYLHEKNICHLDIKPDNILYRTKVDEQGKHRKIYKLSDFGSAIQFANPYCTLNADNLVSTEDYTGPEVKPHRTVLAKPLDIYALGISVCVSLSGLRFEWKELAEALNNWNQNLISKVGVSEALARLVANMISRSPSERPSIQLLTTFLCKPR